MWAPRACMALRRPGRSQHPQEPALRLTMKTWGDVARSRRGFPGHLPAQANVSNGIQQLGDGWRAKMRTYAPICGEHGGKIPTLEKGRLCGVVDDIVSVLAAKHGAQFQHDGLRHDQSTAQIQVTPHALWIKAQPAHDFAEPA